MSRTVSPTTADAGAVPTDRELRASARGNIGLFNIHVFVLSSTQ